MDVQWYQDVQVRVLKGQDREGSCSVEDAGWLKGLRYGRHHLSFGGRHRLGIWSASIIYCMVEVHGPLQKA